MSATTPFLEAADGLTDALAGMRLIDRLPASWPKPDRDALYRYCQTLMHDSVAGMQKAVHS